MNIPYVSVPGTYLGLDIQLGHHEVLALSLLV